MTTTAEFEIKWHNLVERTKKTGKIVRQNAGSYILWKNERLLYIYKLEEGDWKGWWIVASKVDYSDPIRTFKEAKQAAYVWGD